MTLPPGHKLPSNQAWAPLYDRYFLPFFALVNEIGVAVTVIDIGANVGDTAAAILTVAPNSRLVCVEGSDTFLPYLRRNLGDDDRVRIIDSFVVPYAGSWQPVDDGSTGHLVAARKSAGSARSVTVAAVLGGVADSDLVVWKSDTDGFDVALLLNDFGCITQRCAVVWFELDPFLHQTESDQIHNLLMAIDRLVGWEVAVVDNLGHLMTVISPGQVETLVESLISWLRVQREVGVRRISYFDIWLVNSAENPTLGAAVQKLSPL